MEQLSHASTVRHVLSGHVGTNPRQRGTQHRTLNPHTSFMDRQGTPQLHFAEADPTSLTLHLQRSPFSFPGN